MTSKAVISIVTIFLAGCAIKIPGKGESAHIVIFGFGIVSVSQPKESAITVTDVHALGVNLSDRPGMKVGVGYSSSTVVTVPDNAEDVRAEISKHFWGPLSVRIPRAKLTKDQNEGGNE